DGEPLAPQELQAHAAHDRAAGLVPGVEILRPQEDPAPDPRGLEPERDLRRVLGRLLEALDPFELRAAALGLPRVDARDVSPDVLLLLFDEVLLLLEGPRLREDPLRLLAAVGRVAAGIDREPAVLEVHDLLGHAVEEAPVVGDDEVRALAPGEVILEE